MKEHGLSLSEGITFIKGVLSSYTGARPASSLFKAQVLRNTEKNLIFEDAVFLKNAVDVTAQDFV